MGWFIRVRSRQFILKDVLYGVWNPSGRLSYTIAKSPWDYPAQVITGGKAGEILSITYTEGQVLLDSMKIRLYLLPGCILITDVSMLYVFFYKRNFGGLNFFTLQKIFTPSF